MREIVQKLLCVYLNANKSLLIILSFKKEKDEEEVEKNELQRTGNRIKISSKKKKTADLICF